MSARVNETHEAERRCGGHLNNQTASGGRSFGPGDAIAFRIRAELVCCDVYGRVNDSSEVTLAQAKNVPDWHDLCYWGEAAARLAEGRCPGYETVPNICRCSCPGCLVTCNHQPVPTPATIDGRVNLHLTPPADLIVTRYDKPDERILVDAIFVSLVLDGPHQWTLSDTRVDGRIVNEQDKPGRRRAATQFSGSLAEYGDEVPEELVGLVNSALTLLYPAKEN